MLGKLIDRPVAVTMGLLAVMVLGIVSVHLLPISLIPDIDVPEIAVRVSAPEMSSRELDETVMRILRQNLMQTSSVQELRSEARDGSGTIRLTFAEGADMDYAFIEVNEKIDRSMGSLRDLERPQVLKSSASDIPAFYLNLTLKDPDVDFGQLSAFAEDVLTKRIEQFPEVAMVDVSGCVHPEILVIPDEDALRQAGLDMEGFEKAVLTANVRLGSLTIRDGEYSYNVKFQSFASDVSDIENIFMDCGGRIFRLKDLAEVRLRPAERTGLVRSDGKEAVSMAVIKQSNAKMAALKSRMDELAERFGEDYPEIEFTVTRDQTELLEYSINNLIKNIIAGIILACIVIFLFMRDFRSPALVALTIPTALIASMLVFHIAGLTINIISLSGLILGVGMMVDNTIVLTDNITSRWQRGESLRKAVLKGTSEVMAPMLSSVLTTCAVFIPLIFVSGMAGAMFYDQAMAVTIVLLTAYAVTVIVIPVYYWQWYRRLPSFRPSPLLSRLSFSGATDVYESVLKWLFRHRWAGWTLFAVSAAGTVLCLALMPRTRLPEITYTDTLLSIDWNSNLTLEQNTARVGILENEAGGSAVQITSMVGQQQFLLRHGPDTDMSGAAVYIRCADAGSLDATIGRLSETLRSHWPDAIFSFGTAGNIFDMVFAEKEAGLVARLRPVSEPEILPEKLEKVLSDIRESLPGTDIPEPPMKRDVLYVADAERMALYGVSYDAILTSLKNALNGNGLFSIIQGNRSIPVVMGVDRKGLGEIIAGQSVKAGDKEIPLSAVMRQSWEEDLKCIVSGPEGVYYPLEMEAGGRRTVRTAMDTIRETVGRNGDFEVDFSGTYFSNLNMMKEMALVLLVSLVLLYLILASQFESLVQPLIILSEIVIDLFFALAVLWICGVSVNLMSLIGLVVVCGIVINDSILKIDTINRLRKDGLGLKHAVMEAGRRRLKAIVMTSLTTILSVCPFLVRGSMGNDLQYPMSLVIIAGMTAGTLISLFFVPVLYYEVYRKK